MYNTVNDTWHNDVGSMNLARYGFTMVYYQGKISQTLELNFTLSDRIYAVGGTDNSSDKAQHRPENTVEVFYGQSWVLLPVTLDSDAVDTAVVSIRG